jgi:hypothetical protein
MAWMDMKRNTLDIVLGPIETYEDELFGYKAAHEGLVTAGRLPGHQLFEKAAMGPGLACRLFRQGRIVLEDGVQLQALQLLGEDLVNGGHWLSPSSPGIA